MSQIQTCFSLNFVTFQIQVRDPKYAGVSGTLLKIYKEEGLIGYFKVSSYPNLLIVSRNGKISFIGAYCCLIM